MRWPTNIRRPCRSLVLIGALLLTLAAPLIPTRAATLTVTKLTDDNTAGTLRNVIATAMAGDTITFQANLTGTITLTSQLVVDKNLTIQGPGTPALFNAGMSPVRVSGDGKVPVLTVTSKSAVTISGLTFSNGQAASGASGGGIDNAGTLTLTSSLIEANKAPNTGGGIFNRGTLTVTNSTLNANDADKHGGGIDNEGTLTVTDTLIEGSSTNNGFGSDGGGLFNNTGGSATVTGSTFLNNYAGSGGAVDNLGTLMLANSTMSTNHANNSGGGTFNGGKLVARNITVVGNNANGSEKDDGGGGIFEGGGNLDIGNSLLANNVAASVAAKGPDILNSIFGMVTDRGNNYFGNSSNVFVNVAGGDISSTEVPSLGPLADNGGPTKTHALLPGSALIDKGSNTLCADPLVGNKDQRGVTRPQGTNCDIGAFEFGGTTTATTPTMTPTMTATTTPTITPTTTTAPMPTMTPTTTTALPPAMAMACTPPAPGSPFALPAFQSQWNQGEALTPNFWGPTVTASLMEQYQETGGQRLVQYFDKGRMEQGVGNIVTNGLLANELITGQMQVGDNAFMARGAANIPVAGDPDNAGPTYAGLGSKGQSLFAPTTNRSGTVVTTTVAADSTVTMGAMMPGSGATAIGAYDATTQHNVPQAFADYRAKAGLSSIGLAKSEPFVTMVKVGGVQKQVMVQVFERRVLTYTAANDPAFQVEMGNIGQHYYRWRYCGA